MNYLQCVITRNRKNIVGQPPVTEGANTNDDNALFDSIKECSWAGCMLEFYEHRQQVQQAKIGKKTFAFCSENCYRTWLRGGYYI